MQERIKWDNGVHKLEFEPPDIFHCYVNGPVTEEEAKRTMTVLLEEVTNKFGPAFFVTHLLSQGEGTFTPEARKYIGTLKPYWKATVLIGGTAIVRAAMNIASRAVNLMSGSKIPMRAVKTLDEAYLALNELRAAEKAGATQS